MNVDTFGLEICWFSRVLHQQRWPSQGLPWKLGIPWDRAAENGNWCCSTRPRKNVQEKCSSSHKNWWAVCSVSQPHSVNLRISQDLSAELLRWARRPNPLCLRRSGHVVEGFLMQIVSLHHLLDISCLETAEIRMILHKVPMLESVFHHPEVQGGVPQSKPFLFATPWQKQKLCLEGLVFDSSPQPLITSADRSCLWQRSLLHHS